MSSEKQRHTKERPCPVCGGHQGAEKGTEQRCHGYLTPKGVYCSRVETGMKNNAGTLSWHPQKQAYGYGTYKGEDIICVYAYVDENGKVLYEICRTPKKQFPMRRPDPGKPGKHIWKRQGVRLVLYHLPEVLKACADGERVFIVEGEKDADSLVKAGVCATCNAFGAKQWKGEYAKSLVGCPEVVIVHDNDSEDTTPPYCGQSHALDVYDSLIRAGIAARVVRAKEGKDASDHLAAGHGVDDFVEVDVDELRVLVGEAAATEERENPKRSWVPFPVEVLPEIVRKIVEDGATGLSCDSAMIAAPLLVALSACIGNSRVLKISTTWSAPSILWVAVIADSGTMKSPALDFVMAPLAKLDHASCKTYFEEVKEYEDAKAELELAKKAKTKPEKLPHVPPEPINPRMVIGDTTVEAIGALLAECPRGLLLHRDELSAWFGSFNAYKGGRGGDVGSWLEFHDGRRATIDRKQHDPIMVKRASVSVVGTIQPHIIKSTVTEDLRSSGLTARLLVLRPPKRKKRWSEQQVPQATIDELTALYERLRSLKFDEQGDPVSVVFSPEAHELWVEFFNEIAEKQFLAEGHEASTLAKLEEKVARIALLIELCMTTDPWQLALVSEVTRAALEAALRIVEWFENEAYRLNDLLDATIQDTQLERLQGWIKRKGNEGVTVRDICRNIRSYRGDRELINRDLVVLVDRKLIRKVDKFVHSRGGPPHTRYWAVGVPSTNGDASTPDGAPRPDRAFSATEENGVTDASTAKSKGDESTTPDGPEDQQQGVVSEGSVDTDNGSIGDVGGRRETTEGPASVSRKALCDPYSLEGVHSPQPDASNDFSSVDGTPDTDIGPGLPPKTGKNPQCSVDASPSVDGTLPESDDSNSGHDARCVDASVTLGDPADELLVAWAEGAGTGAVPSQPTRVRKRTIQDPTELLKEIVARFHLNGALSQLERADLLALWRSSGQKPDEPPSERSAPDDLDEWGTV